MTPLYPAGEYAPLPRFSKKTQMNSAPIAIRKTANARCSREAPVITVAWSSKGFPPFPLVRRPRRIVTIDHGTRTRARRIASRDGGRANGSAREGQVHLRLRDR